MEIKIGTHTELGNAVDKLRQMVFIEEQGVPKEEIFDGMDLQAVHVVILDGDTPTATARILNNGNNWRIGLVAVAKSRRGQHLGEKVMKVAMDYIIANGGKEIILTAQQQVHGFYEKLGFAQCGEGEELESGVVLVPMNYCR